MWYSRLGPTIAMSTERATTPGSSAATAFTARVWLVVAAFLLFVASTRAIYALSLRQVPPRFELLAWLGTGLMFAQLVRRDRAVRRIQQSPTDLALVVLIAWPIAVPCHFFLTRGRGGWRPCLAFLGAYVGTYVVVAILFVIARLIIYGA